MTSDPRFAGRDAVAAKGWWRAHKWLIARRVSQAVVLGLFLIGPLTGLWLVTGNLASSLTLGILPLSDPYILLQSFAAGQALAGTALLGAAIVLVAYALIGGRVYCSWVCPINPITDLAAWLRRRLGLKGGAHIHRQVRYWILAATLIVAFASGTIAWELVNPVTIVFRGVVFGLGFAWAVALAVFLYDLFVANRGWCGHLCPVGAFYSLPAMVSLLRVGLPNRDRCNDCNDCFAVCPEPQVITPALKGTRAGPGRPVILGANCTNCGRCIDVCSVDVFAFASRFGKSTAADGSRTGQSATSVSGVA